MVRNDIQVNFTQHQRALCPKENPVQGSIKAALCHGVQIATCCKQSSFVDEIGDVRTHHTWSSTSDCDQVHVLCQEYAARVNPENSQATIPVGAVNRHLPVEAARAQEGLVQPIWPVRGSNDHNALVRFEAIHLDHQLA